MHQVPDTDLLHRARRQAPRMPGHPDNHHGSCSGGCAVDAAGREAKKLEPDAALWVETLRRPKFLRRCCGPSGLLPRGTPTGSRRLPWQFTILLVQAAVCKALRSDGPVHVDAMRRERLRDEACPRPASNV